MSRVRGQFPDQAEDALIRRRWLERAKERVLKNPVIDGGRPVVAGVDVGGGQAETVVFLCDIRGNRRRVIKMGAWRADDTRGQVVQFLAPYRNRLKSVVVDGTGIGHNFGFHLRDEGFPVELVKVGLPCRNRPELGENDPSKRFVNEKARLYQNLADAFEHDQVEGLSDETTLRQLADLRYEIDSHGRMRIESKQKARARRQTSPDRAEALMLAIGHRREPSWLDSWSAAKDRRQGRTIEAIADELEASDEVVGRWIAEDAASEAAQLHSPYEPDCAHCHQIIRIDDPKGSYMGKLYHESCLAKVKYGPHAGIKPVPLLG